MVLVLLIATSLIATSRKNLCGGEVKSESAGWTLAIFLVSPIFDFSHLPSDPAARINPSSRTGSKHLAELPTTAQSTIP